MWCWTPSPPHPTPPPPPPPPHPPPPPPPPHPHPHPPPPLYFYNYCQINSLTDNSYRWYTVYPKKYAHGFVVLCFVVVTQSFIMNSHEVFIHIHQGCFAGTGAIVRLPQCQWSKPDGYGKISQCITTTKHIKAKTVCIFLGIYCIYTFFFTVWWSFSRTRNYLNHHRIYGRDT